MTPYNSRCKLVAGKLIQVVKRAVAVPCDSSHTENKLYYILYAHMVTFRGCVRRAAVEVISYQSTIRSRKNINKKRTTGRTMAKYLSLTGSRFSSFLASCI